MKRLIIAAGLAIGLCSCATVDAPRTAAHVAATPVSVGFGLITWPLAVASALHNRPNDPATWAALAVWPFTCVYIQWQLD